MSTAMTDVHVTFSQQGLVRPVGDRVLGGVCAGLGRRFGLDPWPARILFVLPLMVIPGSQLLLYPILWILMPSEDQVDALWQTTQPTYRTDPAPPSGTGAHSATSSTDWPST